MSMKHGYSLHSNDIIPVNLVLCVIECLVEYYPNSQFAIFPYKGSNTFVQVYRKGYTHLNTYSLYSNEVMSFIEAWAHIHALPEDEYEYITYPVGSMLDWQVQIYRRLIAPPLRIHRIDSCTVAGIYDAENMTYVRAAHVYSPLSFDPLRCVYMRGEFTDSEILNDDYFKRELRRMGML